MGAGRSYRAGMLGAVALAVVLAGAPTLTSVPALAESGQATIPDAAEAWYSLAPSDACTSPVGCLPAQAPVASAFPPDTLRVSVTAGAETARAFVVPALSALPPLAVATAGTLVLPIDTDLASGTASPERATLVACLTTQPVPDGAVGYSDPPPTSDCKTSAPVRFNGGGAPTLSVDLGPFLSRWAAGAPRYGVALQAVSTLTHDQTFAVTLNGRKRPEVPHAHARVSYDVEETSTEGASAFPTPLTDGSDSGAAAAPEIQPGSEPELTHPVAPAVAPLAPTRPPTVAVATTRAAAISGYSYPVAMLMPLLLLLALLFLVRTFTSDATPLAFRRT